MRRHAARVAIGLALVVVAAEIGCRSMLGLGSPPLYVADSKIEYLMKPSQDVMRFGNRIIVNEYSMRSESLPDHGWHVVVFGDSVINGGSQIDHGQLATTLAGQELSRKLGRHVAIGNVSAKSWGPGNWREYLERYGSFNARVVALVVNSGDYADNPTFSPLDSNTHPTEAPLLALQEAMARYLPRYLPLSIRRSAVAAAPAPPSATDIDRGMADLRSFLADASRTSRVVVLHHPDRDEVRGPYLPGHAAMRSLCETMGIPFVEMRPWYGDSETAQRLYLDSIHMNAEGQQRIAAALTEFLTPWLDDAAPGSQ